MEVMLLILTNSALLELCPSRFDRVDGGFESI